MYEEHAIDASKRVSKKKVYGENGKERTKYINCFQLFDDSLYKFFLFFTINRKHLKDPLSFFHAQTRILPLYQGYFFPLFLTHENQHE